MSEMEKKEKNILDIESRRIEKKSTRECVVT